MTVNFSSRYRWLEVFFENCIVNDVSISITDVADSITALRVGDTIKKKLGKSLSVADMAKAVTIANQISLLEELT